MILGSFVAVFGGWIAAIAFTVIFGAVRMTISPAVGAADALLYAPLAIGLYAGAFILLIWPTVFLPLYALVPRSSVLWRWPICTACGFAAGPLCFAVLALLLRVLSPPPEQMTYIRTYDFADFLPFILSAIVGGATCLIASLTYDRFADRL